MSAKDLSTRKERIYAIAMQLIASQIKKKELNENNDAQMNKAVRAAVKLAAETFDAATEYVSG